MGLRFRRGDGKTVEIFHLDPSSTPEAYSLTADVTVIGGLFPMPAQAHALEGADLIDPHELYLDTGTDVRVADRLLIDSKEFFVKRISKQESGRSRYIRCSLTAETD